MHDFGELLATPEWRLLAAVLIGLLIGTDRERHKATDKGQVGAGLRTFTLVCLLGGLGALTQMPIMLALGGLFAVGASLIAINQSAEHGLTTGVALIVTFILGVMTQSQPVLALGIGVAVTVLLAARNPLHHFVRDTLTERELDDGMLFVFSAAVVLPILPDRAIGPYALFNPFALWRLVVVLIGVGAAAHWAMRVVGPRFGLLLTGFLSGFISSTIGIATMGSRARADPDLMRSGSAGAVASITGSLVYLIALVAATNFDLVHSLTWPFACALFPLLAYAGLLSWKARTTPSVAVDAGAAVNFFAVLIFVVLVGLFALIGILLARWLGPAGILAGAIVAGIADAHAASVSIATLENSGRIGTNQAALALLVGLSVNMIAKVPTAFALGTRQFAARVSVGLGLLVGGLWIGYMLGPVTGV